MPRHPRPRRPAAYAARRHRNPGLHAGRHAGHGQRTTQRDLEDLDAQILLANTYHLFLRPGHELIRQLGGLHQFMSWPQRHPHRFGRIPGVQPERSAQDRRGGRGVPFAPQRRPRTPSRRNPPWTCNWPTAATSMMVLDECPEYPVSHEYARQSMQRTVRWARPGQPSFPAAHGREPDPPRPVPHRAGLHVPGPAARVRHASWSIWIPTATRSAASRWASRGRSAWKWWRPPRTILPRDQAALRHGRRDAGGTARVRGPRHRHDGLRPAVAQRAQRISVYLRGAGHHQARAV